MPKSTVNYIIHKYKKQNLWKSFTEEVDQYAEPPWMMHGL